MNRIRMGRLTDLPPGASIEKRLLARRVVVVNDNGDVYAIEGDCKHMKASLANGRIADGVVTCTWHGWRYDLATGECLTTPGFRLKTYPVEIVDDDIYVHI